MMQGTRADSGRLARPVAIHRSGHSVTSRGSNDPGASMAGVFSADGQRSKAGPADGLNRDLGRGQAGDRLGQP